MIALHARRSAASMAAWRSAYPDRPLLLVLTGTDLYRDIDSDAAAQRSLAAADALVVLNELGAACLPPPLRPRCHVLLQSCAARQPLPKTRAASARADGRPPARGEGSADLLRARRRGWRRAATSRFDHIGGALDPALGEEAAALQRSQPRYRWLGALPHAATRRRIQARACAGACQPHGRRRARGHRGGAQRHAGAGLAHRRQRRAARRRLRGLLPGRATPRRWRPCWSARATMRLCCPACSRQSERRAPLFAPAPAKRRAAPTAGRTARPTHPEETQ